MKRDTRKLYGATVPLAAFDDLKLVADVLARQTFTNLHARDARKLAARVALEAFVKMSRGRKGE